MADTTSLSSFPNNIDTFDRVSDLSVQQGTFAKAKTYKSYIDAENYSQAEQYLKSNPDLAGCAVNAGMYNKHSDAIVALEEKALEDREYTINGLTIMNDRLDTVHSEFSTDSSETNTVLLNTIINSSKKDSRKIKGDSYISVGCNSKNDLTLSFSKNGDIPIDEDKYIGKIHTYNSNGDKIQYDLYQRSFCVLNKTYFTDYFEDNFNKIFIPNTNWVGSNGLSTDLRYHRKFVSIEGSIILKNTYRVYPIGYNDGTISINACLSLPSGLNSNLQSTHNYIAIKYSGISKNDIQSIQGIIKYTRETA